MSAPFTAAAVCGDEKIEPDALHPLGFRRGDAGPSR